MKKLKSILLIICVSLILAPAGIQAQDTGDSPAMVLKTNPLAALGGPFWVTIVPLTGEYKVLYEIRTTQKQSVMFGASFLGPSLILNLDEITADEGDISGINTSGFRGQIWYKFYIGNTTAPEGFYLAPHVSYAAASLVNKDNTSDKLKMTKLSIDAVIGYQLIAGNGFALDIYTGLGGKNMSYTAEGDSGETFDFDMEDKFKASVTFGLNFGYAF